jgi:tetratricopeptide (TPR) repeat protein
MTLRVAVLLAAVLALSGCHRKAITKLERDEAANLVSEAEFAVTLKEWPRAEDLYSKAVKLSPDAGDTWVNLGIVRMRQDDHSGARTAFKSAISAFKDEFAGDPTHTQAVIHCAYVLVILGRTDEARSFVDKARASYPDDRLLRSFVESKSVDRMMSDPGLKSLSP